MIHLTPVDHANHCGVDSMDWQVAIIGRSLTKLLIEMGLASQLRCSVPFVWNFRWDKRVHLRAFITYMRFGPCPEDERHCGPVQHATEMWRITRFVSIVPTTGNDLAINRWCLGKRAQRSLSE